MCLPTLVLIAQAFFLSEREQADRHTDRQTEQTDKQTRLNALSHVGCYTADVVNYEAT